MKPNIAIVLAGGSGKRLGADRPKQFLRVRGKTILEHTVDAFEQNENIAEIAIVSNPNFMREVEQIVEQSSWKKVKHVLPGGKERYDSSMAALKAYQGKDVNLLLHDGVRPLVSQAVINRVCKALQQYAAIGVALPAVDTIVEVDNDCISTTPDRSRLRRMQTPQAFHYQVIEKAYQNALADPHFKATDDCGVVIKYLPDVKVHLVEGEESNLKLTYKEDLPILERHFSNRETALHPVDAQQGDQRQTVFLKQYCQRNLREMQLKMLDILCEIREVLNKHQIPYWLDAETLLGAVRYGGFCPWSHQVKICVCEEHYEQFLETAQAELPVHLWLQPMNSAMPQSGCHVTDTTSLVLETSADGNTKPQGIYVSVTPLCNYSHQPNGLTEKWGKDYAESLAYVTSPQQMGYGSSLVYAYHQLKKGITQLLWNSTLCHQKETHFMGYPLPLFNQRGNMHQVSTLFPLTTISFEGEEFQVPANEDQYLQDCYGDYMHYGSNEGYNSNGSNEGNKSNEGSEGYNSNGSNESESNLIYYSTDLR